MKKLCAFSALFLRMLGATAFAESNDWINFTGTYEMSASGSCIHSEQGFTINSKNGWYNANDGVVYAGTTVSTGTWVFKKGGQGTYSYEMYATVTPPVQQATPAIVGGVRIFTADGKKFTYKINHFGDITIQTEEGDTLYGSISIDRKTITLIDQLRIKGPGTGPSYNPWYKIICTATRTLIKVGN